ncbi:hypothetical protein [Pseudofrankia asymbiotica]|uniref:hypothetical protein n=1 Tax=Pseudofrankia asymbiotica TaxID=1834516 RepID=UPI0013040D3B|nr:hypothetical protein [Pseudofrankia asymbiotica]
MSVKRVQRPAAAVRREGMQFGGEPVPDQSTARELAFPYPDSHGGGQRGTFDRW